MLIEKETNVLAGLVDEKTQLFFCPYLAHNADKAHAGTVNFIVYLNDSKNFAVNATASNFLNCDANGSNFIFTVLADDVYVTPISEIGNNGDLSIEFLFLQPLNVANQQGFFGNYYGTAPYLFVQNHSISQLTIGFSTYAHTFTKPVVNQVHAIMHTYNFTSGVAKTYVDGIEILSTNELTGFASNRSTPLDFGSIGNIRRNDNLEIGDVRISTSVRSLNEHLAFVNNCYYSRLNNFSI